MNKYIMTPIRDIGTIITGKTPATFEKQYYDGEYMFITPVELHDGYNITCSEKTITEAGLRSIATNSIDGTSVLVGCIGWDMGNVAMCHERCATNQQINSITNFKSQYNPYYTYYWLSQKKDYLFSIATVTRTPILNKGTFEEVNIPMPSKEIQDSVVAVLRSFDEKIAVNTRICTELESMAKTIYDYWFTQFDFPDENGRPYRTSGGEMVWNEQLKREIPKGWEVKPLGNICGFRNGINYEKGCQGECVYRIANVRNVTASTFLMDTEDFDEIILPKEQGNRYLIDSDDIIIARSGNPGATRLIMNPSDNVIFCGFIICCTPTNSDLRFFIAHTLKRLEGTNATKTGGSILQNVSQDTLTSLSVCLPDDSVLDGFNEKIRPLIGSMNHKIRENRELTKLRDWLLPMLMNGQAKVE